MPIATGTESDRWAVRRLEPGDEDVLERLAREDAAFDLEGRGEPSEPLTPEGAAAYLASSNVLHWVVEEDGQVIGTLICHILRLDSGDGIEMLLYDIGVRAGHRRRGIGRRLLTAMDHWMADHGVAEVWVLADNPGAEAFYRALGFERPEPQPVYLTRRRT